MIFLWKKILAGFVQAFANLKILDNSLATAKLYNGAGQTLKGSLRPSPRKAKISVTL